MKRSEKPLQRTQSSQAMEKSLRQEIGTLKRSIVRRYLPFTGMALVERLESIVEARAYLDYLKARLKAVQAR